MKSRSERKIFRQVVEGAAAIGLVLLFFFIIMSVLNLFFPSGGGFSLFMKKQEIEQVNETIKHEHDLHLSRNGHSNTITGGTEWAAQITATRNDVKSKRAFDIAWKNAKSGMKLYNQDAIQTLGQSTVLIQFDDQNEIDLGENSLLVIRRMEQDLIFKEKRSYMVIVDGELRGRIGGAQDDGVYLEVTTPNAVARLQNTAQSDTPLEFRINVEEDNASTITLFSGEAEVEAQGETVFLETGQMTQILTAAPPSAPTAVPKRVLQQTPINNKVFAYRSLPPQVQLIWQANAGMTGYRMQLARDRQFHDIVLDEQLNKTEFFHGNLKNGDYFWRVSGERNGIEGDFSPARKFSLIHDQKPPILEVNFPLPTVTTASVELYGKSESGSLVFISGEKVTTDENGEFHYTLPVSRGTNVVVVEAVDQAGNVSFSSKMITGAF